VGAVRPHPNFGRGLDYTVNTAIIVLFVNDVITSCLIDGTTAENKSLTVLAHSYILS